MNFFKRVGLCAVLIGMAGCVSQPPATGPSGPTQPSNLPPPTATPPVAIPPKSDEPRALSPLAAPTSGGVAYYQTRQEQQLHERLDGTGIRIARAGDSIRLVLPANAAFALNGDQLQPRYVDWLTTVALVLREYSKTSIEIKGYTDSTGSFEHNQNLSAQRAQAVGAILIGKQIAAARIHTAGFGPRNPIADNKTDTGRAQNRRVEIELVPLP